jgi:hypothetical protein
VESNVAMVESTEPTVARVAQSQSDQSNGTCEDSCTSPDALETAFPVDLDYQQALNNSDVNI